MANDSIRPAEAKGIKLNPLDRKIDDSGYHYKHVDVTFDRGARTVTLTVHAPEGDQPRTVGEIHAAGDQWWPLAMARELDDAILMLRINEAGAWAAAAEDIRRSASRSRDRRLDA